MVGCWGFGGFFGFSGYKKTMVLKERFFGFSFPSCAQPSQMVRLFAQPAKQGSSAAPGCRGGQGRFFKTALLFAAEFK